MLLGSPPAGFSPDRCFFVALKGGDVDNIADAITKVNALSPAPSAAAPAAIVVFPGVYSTPPFTLPNYTSLIGVGGSEAVVLDASTATAALASANGGQRISGLTLRDASGVGGIGIAVVGTVGSLLVEDCYVYGCETGISCDGAGRSVDLVSTQVETCDTGVYINGAGAEGDISNLVLVDLVTGLHLGTGGGSARGSALRVVDDAGFTTHVLVEAASSQLDLIGSVFREDKAVYHASADIRAIHASDIAGDVALQVVAELHVGSEDRPRESAFGGGDSHTRDVAYLTNTNLEIGTWNDITSQLKSLDATSVNLFAGTAVGNAFYVGGDQQFPGIKAAVTTARVGGALVLEYWNGATWVSIEHLSSDADSPYGQYAQDVFNRVNSEQIRFNTEAISGWATKALNGITKYWIRFRVSTALTTSPAADQIKAHTNRTEINLDGVVEYFGAAEPINQLIWHRLLLEELTGFAQPNVDIDIATAFSLKANRNRFQNGNKDGSGSFTHAVEGLDTSRPLIYEIGWAPEATGAGDVELQLDVVTVNAGDVVDGTLPYTRQLSQIITGPFTALTLQVTRFAFTVPDLESDGSLALALYRDASGANLDDTFAADAKHIYSRLFGTFWR